jgi:CubicO group peptidase (beta-lactamase class C family)
MRNDLRPLFILCFVMLCFEVSSQYNDAAKRIDSLFASYNANTPGAAVAVIRDGKVIFSKGYGMADLEHNIPVTTKTVFNIASVSKQFTAFAIHLLQSEGKISFEDDVRRYITELPDYGTTIKIKHLLAHTSGLRDQAALLSIAGRRPGDVVTTEEILKLAAKQKALNFTPGTAFNYNNTGYTLLAEIVARVSGKSFAAYTNEKIFIPLGMANTNFEDNHETIVKNRAQSYDKMNGVYHRKPINTSNVGPSNLLTTVEDLTKWVLNFEKPVVGTAQLLNAFNETSYLDNGQKVVLRVFAPGDTAFHAKGQNLSLYKGLRMWTHGGHTAAFRTFLGRFPDQRFGVIALSNDEHNERLNARWQIADLYLKDVMKEEPAVASSPVNMSPKPTVSYTTDLKAFEGEYHSDELSTSYRFVVRNDQLFMTHMRLSDVKLNRTGENSFSGSGPEAFAFQMEFVRDASGNVHAFMLTNFGVKNIRFEKKK